MFIQSFLLLLAMDSQECFSYYQYYVYIVRQRVTLLVHVHLTGNDQTNQKPQTENFLINKHDSCDNHLYTSTRLAMWPFNSLKRFTDSSLQILSQLAPLISVRSWFGCRVARHDFEDSSYLFCTNITIYSVCMNLVNKWVQIADRVK